MDCFIWARKEIKTAPFPKAKEYQKLKIKAYNQEEDEESEEDLCTTDEDTVLEEESEEQSEEELEPHNELKEDFSDEYPDQEQAVSTENTWWQDYGSDSE